MPTRLALKILPTAFMTFAVAGWMSAVVGAGKLPAIVVTFAWVTASGQELLTAQSPQKIQEFRWSLDHIFRALGGLVVWLGLPWVQSAHPDAWFCVPVSISPTFAATGAILAMCFPLYPFMARLRGRQISAASYSPFRGAVLHCSFFLVSGQLVFAAIAYIAVGILLADRVKRRQWSCGVPAALSLCVADPHRAS